jgi:hypothetical protein
VLRPKKEAPATQAVPKPEAVAQPEAPEPGTPESAARVRTQITDMIKANLPDLTKVFNEGMKKEAEKQARKSPQKEMIPTKVKKPLSS